MREELIDLLVRLILDGVLTEQEAASILDYYDQYGELPPGLELPLDLDEAIPEEIVVIVLAYLATRPTSPEISSFNLDQYQQNFTRQVQGLGRQWVAGEITLQQWQRRFRDHLIEFLTTSANAGAMRDLRGTPQEERVLQSVQIQLAYLSRLADNMAVDQVTEGQLNTRSALYGGEGRALYYEQRGISNAQWGWVEDYVAIDDRYTCNPCRTAESRGPYLPGVGVQPGRECLGRGYCRCERLLRYDPPTYLRLTGQAQVQVQAA